MPTDPSHHLIIAFASCREPGWAQTMQSLPSGSLKNLEKLMQGMKPLALEVGEAHSLSMPHERILARELGLQADEEGAGQGLIPWAAWQASQLADGKTGAGMQARGKAWAFITPCHWSMGRENATLNDPAALALTLDESKTLMAAMQPYFAEDGITLHEVAPGSWLAEGELFRTVPAASLERVMGRNVDAWLPPAQSLQTKTLRRLQNEMQMLLYTHPVNDARSARRQQTINSIWISGTGAMDSAAQPAGQSSAPTLARNLAAPAMADDWTAYAAAWQTLDTGPIADLLAVQSGTAAKEGASGKKGRQPVKLTFCSETSAQTFMTAPTSLKNRISSLLAPQRPINGLEKLLK